MTEPLEFYWLAGLLEGEGSFFLGGMKRYKNSVYKYAQVALNMTDEDVVRRAAALVGNPSVIRIKHPGESKDSFQWRVGGAKAVRLMQRLKPFMGERRQAKITEVLEAVQPQELPSW